MLFAKVAGFIEEGGYFDDDLKFDSAQNFEPASDTNPRGLEVRYKANKRPIFVQRLENGLQRATFAEAVGEIKERAENAATITDLTARIGATCQAFYFEFDEIYLTEEPWTMLDSLEALLARELDGVIHASEGFTIKICNYFASSSRSRSVMTLLLKNR